MRGRGGGAGGLCAQAATLTAIGGERDEAGGADEASEALDAFERTTESTNELINSEGGSLAEELPCSKFWAARLPWSFLAMLETSLSRSSSSLPSAS